MRNALSLSLGAAVIAMSSMAGAQDVSVSTTAAQPSNVTSTGGSITDTSGPTDHSVVVGRLGLRYFGTVTVPVLGGAAGGVPNFDGTQGFADVNRLATGGMTMTGSAQLHTVGLRYWLNNSLGLEGGISFGIGSGSTSTTVPNPPMGNATTPSDQPNFFGIGLHAGVPIMLAESKHLSINLSPYVAFQYASSAIQRSPNATTTVDLSASSFLFSLGANLGAELQFGFIGIPQLALQAQFGLSMRYATATVRSVTLPGNLENSNTQSGFGIATTVGPNYGLADIIGGSISAVYYFGGSR